MSVYQKTMFDRYYCIVILLLEKIGKNAVCFTYNGTQKHEGFIYFKKACSRAESLNYGHFYACYCWRQFL